MTPADFISLLDESYDLPASVIELLDALLDHEILNDYRLALSHTPKYHDANDPEQHPSVRLAKGLDFIFAKLPKIYDSDSGRLTTTIHDLRGWTQKDTEYIWTLRTPLEKRWQQEDEYDLNQEVKNLLDNVEERKKEVRAYQRVIDFAESGEDVRYEKAALRSAKEDLKEAEDRVKGSCEQS